MKPVPLVVTFALGLALGALGATSRSPGWFADSRVGPEAAATAPAMRVTPGSPQDQSCPDEAQLRRVVREELANASAAGLAAQGSPPRSAADVPPAPAPSPEQVALVNRQLDGYIQAGVISDSEMALLQSEIGKLDPAARRAALQKLVRAMNSGALDGRL